MSASPVFSSAALGCPFIFVPPRSPRSNAEKTAQEETARKTAEILSHVGAIPKFAAAVVPASRLDVRPAPEMVSSGIPQLDLQIGGLPRGCLTEICGTASSGRTSILLVALARATQRGEVCALVDASDAFDPVSAAAAGMEMSRLLWVRCGEKYSPRKHLSAVQTSAEKTGDSYANNVYTENSHPGIHPAGSQIMPTGSQVMPAGSHFMPAGSEVMPAGSHFMPAAVSYQGMPSGIPQGLREGHDFSRAVNPQFSPALAAEGRRPVQHQKSLKWNNPEARRWESQLAQTLKVTDLLLQSNGFGMIALDLGDIPMRSARRIPLASWFRFRRAVEHTPTVLLVMEQQPIAGSCSSVLLKVSGARPRVSGKLSAVNSLLSGNSLAHSELLDQFEITVELLRTRLERAPERKPVQSTTSFKSRAAWA